MSVRMDECSDERAPKTPLSFLSIRVQPLAHTVVAGHRNLGGVSLLGLLLSINRLDTDLAATWSKLCSSVVEKGENSGFKMSKQGLGEIHSSVGRVFA